MNSDEPSARRTGRPKKEPSNTLSARLRQLREQAGLSGTDAARKAGLTQSKISRTETGKFAPTPEQVETLCRVYKAPAALRRELVRMASELQEDRIPARVVLERGGWELQERIGRIEQAADHIRCIAPTVVPGLLQSDGYIRALFADSLSPADRERTIAARVARQQLLETSRTFAFVLTEGALRWNLGGAVVMADQIERLIEESLRENVDIGIVPWTTPVTLPLLHSVDFYDQRAVMFGTISATALITDPAVITEYEDHWAELAPFVVHGDETRAELRRIAADYRSLG